MNESFFKKAKESIRSISMTSSEKKMMVKRIMETTVSKTSVRSTWNMFSFASFVSSHRIASAFAAFVLVFLGGNSILAASKSALPGDALYSLKVNVAEPMRLALASDFATEAHIQSETMQTRFEEAELLAINGDLDEEKELELSVRVAKQVSDFNINIKKIQEVSVEKAMEVTDTAQAGIRAHARLLATISLERGEKTAKLSHATRDAALALGDENQVIATARVMNQSVEPKSKKNTVADASVPAPTVTALTLTLPDPTDTSVGITATSVVKTILPTTTEDSARAPQMKAPETTTAIMQSNLIVEVSSTTDREFRKQIQEEEIFQKAKEKLEKRTKKTPTSVISNKEEVIQSVESK
ncbi:MAG: hypothetical protein M3Q80_00990 [bacterium]|nr:hypothetical protein [bacterium]